MRVTIALASLIVLAGPTAGGHSEHPPASAAGTDQQVRDALRQTSAGIREAYTRSDVAGVMSFHHPDVTKALGFDRYLIGSAAVEKSAAEGMRAFQTEFIEHEVESVLVREGSAVQMTRYAIRRMPRAGGEANVFRARALVVFVRSSGSPTGWAVIREIVQPAPH